MSSKSFPRDFAKPDELAGTGNHPGIYDLTDNVSDEQFEEALKEAKEEGNLSRTNVAVHGVPVYSSRYAAGTQ